MADVMTIEMLLRLQQGIAFIENMNAENFVRLKEKLADNPDPKIRELLDVLEPYANARTELSKMLVQLGGEPLGGL